METVRVIAVTGAVCGLLFAMASMAPLVIYFDFASAVIVAFGVAGLAVLTFDDLGWFVNRAMPRFLMPSSRTSLGVDQSLKAACIARTVGEFALIIGSIATLIGGNQMVQNLEDPSVIGPALAVAFLTNLYGIFIVAFVCFPMNRYFLREAQMDRADTPNTMIGVYAQILSTVVVIIPIGSIYFWWTT